MKIFFFEKSRIQNLSKFQYWKTLFFEIVLKQFKIIFETGFEFGFQIGFETGFEIIFDTGFERGG